MPTSATCAWGDLALWRLPHATISPVCGPGRVRVCVCFWSWNQRCCHTIHVRTHIRWAYIYVYAFGAVHTERHVLKVVRHDPRPALLVLFLLHTERKGEGRE